MEIDGSDFFDGIEEYKENKLLERSIISEKSNYGPDKTGLPISVYVDDTSPI